MNAIELLKKDHREVEDLFQRIESADDSTPDAGSKKQIFARLRDSLLLHAKLEEQFLYPVLEEFKETEEMADHSYEEHDEVEQLLAKLDELEGEEFDEKIVELKGNVLHHVDEEENDLFIKAEKILGQQRLTEIGQKMLRMKESKGAEQSKKQA